MNDEKVGETTVDGTRLRRYREYTAGSCDNCGGCANTPAGHEFVWVYYPEGAKGQAEAQAFCQRKCRDEWRARNIPTEGEFHGEAD